MALWNSDNIILTKIGSEILSKVQAGVGKLTITKIVTGAGYVSPAQLYNQTAVTKETQNMSILNTKTDERGSVVEVQINNDALEKEYDLYQIGVYVQHQDYSGDQLYLIAQCDTANPDHIPLPSVTPVSLNYSLYIEHNNVPEITITVDPNGVVSNATFNEFKEEVNNQFTIVNEALDNVYKINSKATYSDGVVSITSPEGAEIITFYAPSDFKESDTYTLNGTPITLTDLNNEPIKDAWKQNSPIVFNMRDNNAYFTVGGASGDFLPITGGTMQGEVKGFDGNLSGSLFRNIQFGTEDLVEGESELPIGSIYITPDESGDTPAGDYLPLAGGTMKGPVVGAKGELNVAQFRNVLWGSNPVIPGETELPKGSLLIVPEDEVLVKNQRVCRFVIGTSTAGWTEADCDYLCDGEADDVEINAAIQALPETGGEIVILDGTYKITAPITLNKDNVTLSGNNASVILQRNWDSPSSVDGGIITITTDHKGCTIKNLQIDGNNEIYDSLQNSGIYLNSCKDNVIEANIFIKIPYGVFLYSSNDNIVTKNILNDSKFGIYLYSSSNNSITLNSCKSYSYGDEGIYLSGNSNYNTVVGNSIFGTNMGIYLNSSSCNTVSGNLSIRNNDGISLEGSGTEGNVITGNLCGECKSSGIYIVNGNSNTITGNTCNNNLIGISLFISTNSTIVGNTCIRGKGTPSDYSSEQYTIRVFSNSSNNLIVGNNIMGKNYLDEGTNNTWDNNKFE